MDRAMAFRQGRGRAAWNLWVVMLGTALLWGSAGCISIDLLGDGAAAPLAESVVRGERGPKILLLDIGGVISGGVSPTSLLGFATTSMVGRVREVLDRASTDEEVRAILLRIDSPGGTATASEQIYREVMRFKTDRQIPVVAQLLTTAASGGYYIAMAAGTVQAHPTTVTGSIGVIFTSVNFAGLMEKLGVEDQTITGGEFKDVGSPFRRLSEEERGQLQSIVDDLHARFREIVAKGRPQLTLEEVTALANGRIYSAPQALENGLVDRIGSLEDAVGLIEDRLGVSSSRVVAYHRPSEQRRNLYARSMPGLPLRVLFGMPQTIGGGSGAISQEGFAAFGLADLLRRPGFHYLWWPGLRTVGSDY
ncbi:MAG: signal peptide peptidase SppA [bacterium]|nr:signal peptide peptidase SppA [Deltaproteobacteria bacterium]MCP4906249.1 signal peptide peptidase SppA [bacterium]